MAFVFSARVHQISWHKFGLYWNEKEKKRLLFLKKKNHCCCLCHTLVALSLLCPNHHMSQELNQRLSNQEKKEGTNCFTRMFIRQLFFCPLFWSRTKRHRPRPRNRVRILIASAHLRIASVPADGPSLAWTRHFLYSRLKIISSAFSTRTTKSIVLFITFATQPYCEPTSLFSPYETTSKINSLLDTCEQKETKKKKNKRQSSLQRHLSHRWKKEKQNDKEWMKTRECGKRVEHQKSSIFMFLNLFTFLIPTTLSNSLLNLLRG